MLQKKANILVNLLPTRCEMGIRKPLNVTAELAGGGRSALARRPFAVLRPTTVWPGWESAAPTLAAGHVVAADGGLRLRAQGPVRQGARLPAPPPDGRAGRQPMEYWLPAPCGAGAFA